MFYVIVYVDELVQRIETNENKFWSVTEKFSYQYFHKSDSFEGVFGVLSMCESISNVQSHSLSI
jgi:hypothetical protein